jgi:hypothetical protein
VNALDLWLLRYDDVHDRFVDGLFKDLGDEDARRRPGAVNSVVWLVWHLTRVQDAAVSRFVGERPQVLDEGRWNEQMRLARRDVGSGMTGEDVDALSGAVDVASLRAYHRAVAARTKEIATSLPAAAWTEIVPAERVRRAVAADALLIDAGRWVEEFWARGLSKGWYLLQVGVLHPYGHCFDGQVTRGLLGLPEN